MRLDEGPDILNFPVDAELDLAGWELRKTLRLLRGSNAALFEWLQSPIVYHEAPGFRAQLAPLRELLPVDLQAIVDKLLAQKAFSNEKKLVALVAWLAAEYAAGQAAREGLPLVRTEKTG